VKIHSANLVAFLLTIVALVLLIRYRHPLGAFLVNLERLGPEHSHDEQAMGLMALGLIGVMVVAIVKILTKGSGR
jgi:hypothetical protein